MPKLQTVVLLPGNEGLCGALPNASNFVDAAGTRITSLSQTTCPSASPLGSSGRSSDTGAIVGEGQQHGPGQRLHQRSSMCMAYAKHGT